MKISHVKPEELVPATNNPRRIDSRTMEALKDSIDRWGFVEPVVVNKKTGSIVGGHQRTAAAVELKLKTVPVTYVDIDEQQEKALNIALNKIAGDWDAVVLQTLLDELSADGWDLGDLGFVDDEVEQIMDAWDDPADLSDVDEYDPEQETVMIKIEVPFGQAGEVVQALNEAIKANGWSFKVNAF